MFILCFSLTVFWVLVTGLFPENKFNQVIKYTGTLSMLVSAFLFTRFHGPVIHVAGILGVLAFCGVFIGLYKNKWTGLFSYGVICLALILVNYIIYMTRFLIVYLPIIQKATFVLFLSWIGLLTI